MGEEEKMDCENNNNEKVTEKELKEVGGSWFILLLQVKVLSFLGVWIV